MLRRSPLAPVLAALALTTMLVAWGGVDDAGSASPSGATATTTDDSVTDLTLTPASPPASVPDVSVPAEAPSELKVTPITEGSGDPVKAGDIVVVDYVGVRQADGSQFDASYGKDPLVLTVGLGQVIQGWDEGVQGMKVGGRRRLTIPPHKGYGSRGAGGVIKGGETLVFVVDLLGVD